MNVTKVINNNIVISENEEKQELVVMGKGLGFKKKPGDVIEYSALRTALPKCGLRYLRKSLSQYTRVECHKTNPITFFYPYRTYSSSE